MDKRLLSERDICTKFIVPALTQAGWDLMSQVREEVYFTKGRIIVRGKLVRRGKVKKADFVLYIKPNIPIALIDAKDNNHSVGDGMQQGLEYSEALGVPFVFASNGDGFVFHDRTGASAPIETDLGLDAFPSPADLWARYRLWKGLSPKPNKSCCKTSSMTAATRSPVIIRPTPSTPRSKRSPKARTGSCW
jgi:type I restriction enzyme R subunit